MKYKVNDIVTQVYDDNENQVYMGNAFKITSINLDNKHPYQTNKSISFSEKEIKLIEIGDTIEWPSCSSSKWKIIGIDDYNNVDCMCYEPNNDSNYSVAQIHRGWALSTAKITKKNNNNNNPMIKVSSMMKRLLDKDTQKLVKAGLINGDLELTSEGVKALNTVIFEVNKAELVKIADEIIAENNEERCK